MAKIIFDLSGTIVREAQLEYDPKMRFSLFEGIKELIETLFEQGHELYIWTMASQKLTLEILKAHELVSFFLDIQTRDHGFFKPDPKGIYELIGKSAGYMIGDSSGDIEAAVQAKITPIAALWGDPRAAKMLSQRGAKELAYHPREILALIK